MHFLRALEAVPQPKLPEHPRLKPWYRVVETGDALVLEYAQTAVVFEGDAAKRLLPALLPLLDGTRTRAEIAERLAGGGGPAAGHVEQALGLLDRHRLLLDGPDLAGSDPPDVAGTVQLMSAAGPGPSLAEVRAAIGRAVVDVVGVGDAAARIVELLRASGVGHVHRAGWPDADAVAVPTRLVVAVPGRAEAGDLDRWNRAAVAGGQVWLQVLPFDGRFAAVGPLYVPGETCCFECYRLRRRATSGYADEFAAIEQAAIEAPSGPALTATVAGIAATVALRWIAYRDPHLPGAFYACEAGGTSLSQHRVYRVPRCSACSGLTDLAPPLPWFKETTDVQARP